MRFIAVFLMALPLSAWAKTISETEGTFVYNDETYSSVTRELERADGSTYSIRTIKVGARFVDCSATDDEDCAGAIRDARSEGDR
ncbi:hypothetical protein [Tateyamaria pelophila]|uniref:hypothetical protein n=1 Tax=Tateyamaria pelophila TaxID=328415 RepID=UPI001CBC7A4D|nr:hypothetical protein [Tateyamaria pelophila]